MFNTVVNKCRHFLFIKEWVFRGSPPHNVESGVTAGIKLNEGRLEKELLTDHRD
jgi:hypothetical protein